MTKSDLIQKIMDQNPHLYAREVQHVVDTIFDEIVSTLEGNARAELRGFGTFFVADRKARNGRNPKTGEQVKVPAKSMPRFKQSKLLGDRLNS